LTSINYKAYKLSWLIVSLSARLIKMVKRNWKISDKALEFLEAHPEGVDKDAWVNYVNSFGAGATPSKLKWYVWTQKGRQVEQIRTDGKVTGYKLVPIVEAA
jgi:hypothetical protein